LKSCSQEYQKYCSSRLICWGYPRFLMGTLLKLFGLTVYCDFIGIIDEFWSSVAWIFSLWQIWLCLWSWGHSVLLLRLFRMNSYYIDSGFILDSIFRSNWIIYHELTNMKQQYNLLFWQR
jgi:hypothetical protein